jgi:hypothetical protein
MIRPFVPQPQIPVDRFGMRSRPVCCSRYLHVPICLHVAVLMHRDDCTSTSQQAYCVPVSVSKESGSQTVFRGTVGLVRWSQSSREFHCTTKIKANFCFSYESKVVSVACPSNDLILCGSKCTDPPDLSKSYMLPGQKRDPMVWTQHRTK